MTLAKTNDAVREIVSGELKALGWQPDLREFMVGRLAVNTFRGPQEAVAWVAPSADDDPNFSITANFRSEGHNVLESSRVLIPKSATEQHIQDLARNFVKDATKKISEAFSVRMLKSPQAPSPGM